MNHRFIRFVLAISVALTLCGIAAGQIETTTPDGRRVVILRETRQPETFFDRMRAFGDGRRPLVGVGGRRHNQPVLNLRVLRNVIAPTRMPRARAGFFHWYAANHILPWGALALVGLTLVTTGMSFTIRRD